MMAITKRPFTNPRLSILLLLLTFCFTRPLAPTPIIPFSHTHNTLPFLPAAPILLIYRQLSGVAVHSCYHVSASVAGVADCGAQALAQEAYLRGSADNISVLVIDLRRGKREAIGEEQVMQGKESGLSSTSSLSVPVYAGHANAGS